MRSLLKNDHGSAAMIGVVVSVLVSIVIGVMVWFKIDGALAGAQTFTTLPSGARAAWNTTNTTANTALTLMPIVAIVLVAGIILAIVTNFGRGQGQ